jgi:hypothetical protein
MILLEVNKLLYISCPCIAFADHFVFVNIDEQYLPKVGAYDEDISFFLVAENTHARGGTYFLHRYVSVMIKVSVTISVKYSDFAV